MNSFFKPFLTLVLSFTIGFAQDNDEADKTEVDDFEFTIAFGSCNNQKKKNNLWQDILKHQPDVWIWGGDNIYADTQNMSKMKSLYDNQLQDANYAELLTKTTVLGTWDDHDYGANDAGEEYPKKKESKALLLDFLGFFKDDPIRFREGIYYSKGFKTENGSVKVILLDTRYFRTALKKAHDYNKRYAPNDDLNATLLGNKQWKWLEKELKTSRADFNIIVSSIQVLSQEHGFETWGNFPNECDKLFKLIEASQAKNVVILSGDRHISEWSKKEFGNLTYPIIDFTSSGLTHSYTSFKGEPNKNRVGEVVSDKSFGLLKFNMKDKTIQFEMRGENNVLQQTLKQRY